MLTNLRGLTSRDWWEYAFSRSPLRWRIPAAERLQLAERAEVCGREHAQQASSAYRSHTPAAIASSMGVEVFYSDESGPQAYGEGILFARFKEPDEITVFLDCVTRANRIIAENGLQDILGPVGVGDALLAHEVFHIIEMQNMKSIFTRTARVRMPIMGIFGYASRVGCLSEIAAMAFAQELLGLEYSPFLLDVLLLYEYDGDASRKLYASIISLSGHMGTRADER